MSSIHQNISTQEKDIELYAIRQTKVIFRLKLFTIVFIIVLNITLIIKNTITIVIS